MAVQLSVSVRNARLNAIETTIGTAPVLILRTGTQPANCAAADSGSVLATLTLPSDWIADAASGAKALSTPWTGTGSASGTPGHFRIKESTNTTTHIQGDVTDDMNIGDIANGAAVTISTFQLTDGNA